MLQAPLFAALNHVLGQASWARARLSPHGGRRARIELPPLPALVFAVTAEGNLEPASAEETADVTIALPAGSPLMVMAGGPESLFKAAHISGKADFADSLGFVLRNLRWDAEEDLSRWVGDIAARRVVGLAGSLFAAQREGLSRLAQNLAEYLADEQGALIRPPEMQSFAADVARLREDVQRLEQRARRLMG